MAFSANDQPEMETHDNVVPLPRRTRPQNPEAQASEAKSRTSTQADPSLITLVHLMARQAAREFLAAPQQDTDQMREAA